MWAAGSWSLQRSQGRRGGSYLSDCQNDGFDARGFVGFPWGLAWLFELEFFHCSVDWVLWTCSFIIIIFSFFPKSSIIYINLQHAMGLIPNDFDLAIFILIGIPLNCYTKCITSCFACQLCPVVAQEGDLIPNVPFFPLFGPVSHDGKRSEDAGYTWLCVVTLNTPGAGLGSEKKGHRSCWLQTG